MAYQNVFERYEIKYLLTIRQAQMLKAAMNEYMAADKYGKTTICNVYFDTPDKLLIRRSNEHPIYKEKLRVRSYGVASDSSQVFIEIKKKYKGVVYKRRVGMDIASARAYLGGGEAVDNKTQIMREISYFMQRYAQLMPSVYISYEREAFLGKSDSGFRITFDRNILWRTQDISLSGDVYGDSLLGEAYVLLEVKTALGLPTWLTRFLSANGIFKMSFSKYGSAYKIMTGEGLGGTEIA